MTTPDTPTRERAVDALDTLRRHDPPAADIVAEYLDQLETSRSNLATFMANATQSLERSKRELMRAGWVAAWLHLRTHPNDLNHDPASAFNNTWEDTTA